MEDEPDTTNVVYIDESPDLKRQVWLRRLNAQREAGVIALPRVIDFPKPPDDAA